MRRQFATVTVGRKRLAEAEFGDEVGLADDALDALPHGHFVDIRRDCAVCARLRTISQGGRDDGATQRHRRLQQRGQEPLQSASVAGGAFGKHGYPGALLHQFVHGLVDAYRVCAPPAFQKQRAALVRQPAKHGPRAYLGFGNEIDAPGPINQVNIQPRDVVAHQQGAARKRRRWSGLHAHAQDFEQSSRPVADQAITPRVAHNREKHPREDHRSQQVQAESDKTVGATEE